MAKGKKQVIHDVLLQDKKDRRMLPDVPDPDNIRSGSERRGHVTIDPDGQINYEETIKKKSEGKRYLVSLKGLLICKGNGKAKKIRCTVIDLSYTGALITLDEDNGAECLERIRNAKRIIIDFEIEPGSMPEGAEMRIRQKINIIRTFQREENGILSYQIGIQFDEPLSEYAAKRKDRFDLTIASLWLLFISVFIILMRAESVLYFKFSKWGYLYSIIAAVFLLSRYFFGALYKPVKIYSDYTPGVTIIIPCFNEETWIEKTIISCVNQDYPIDKLEVLVVDDCSTDKSPQVIQDTIARLEERESRYNIRERVKYVPQPKNGGKREALARGAKIAKHELIVFVDSDSFLDVYAIRNLVQPFQDPQMGGVSGRTDVANTYTNALTKMQSVRYYIAFRIMKAAEAYFDAVTCLSGPLSCYKKSVVLENMDAWLNQKFLGQRATFGDDRSMTNFILRHHRTSYQDTAVCYTIVPNDHRTFLKQQMRWKRSWLRESLVAARFMWRKEPFMAVFFYAGLIVPIAAPIVVLYNLIYIPLTRRVFPTTFLVGLLMMSLLMSVAQLFLRKSKTWLYGLLFCFYYEAVLLWQMPWAWVTFWKSTWGTRMTPEDVKEAEKKAEKKRQREEAKAEKDKKAEEAQDAEKAQEAEEAKEDEEAQAAEKAL